MSKILVVDDNIDFQEMLNIVLSKEHKVFCANHKNDMVDILASETIDLILSDFHLTDCTAADILNSLDAEGKLPKIPIIIISGSGILSKTDFNVEISRILCKPFKIAELRQTINEIIESH